MQDPRQRTVTLDLVVPMKNEASALPLLLGALAGTFSPEVRATHGLGIVTCIFVDDGSDDESVEIVQRSADPTLAIEVIRLSRNFGHQAAITAGLAHARGDLVAVIDADLQDPPHLLLEMVGEWRKGFDVVLARRRSRQGSALKRGLYWGFYRLYRVMSPIAVPVDSGDFALMSRRVVTELNKLPETVRFIRGLRSWLGFPHTFIDYDRPARIAGTPSYGWREMYRLATDGLVALSLRPLQLTQFLALVYLLLSLLGAWAVIARWFDPVDVRTQLSLLLLVILLSNGLIMFSLYILGAYLGRTYLETKARPPYVVAEIIRRDPAAPS
jgi:glycosyltransferase involved in cell wall biosynthesis